MHVKNSISRVLMPSKNETCYPIQVNLEFSMRHAWSGRRKAFSTLCWLISIIICHFGRQYRHRWMMQWHATCSVARDHHEMPPLHAIPCTVHVQAAVQCSPNDRIDPNEPIRINLPRMPARISWIRLDDFEPTQKYAVNCQMQASPATGWLGYRARARARSIWPDQIVTAMVFLVFYYYLINHSLPRGQNLITNLIS